MISNISVGIFIHNEIKTECQILKNTYLKNFKYYLFFGADEDNELPTYTYKNYNLADDYYSALAKQFLCLKKQYELHNSCEWYFVAGYDTYLHGDNAKTLLSRYPHDRPCYIGGHGDVRFLNEKKYYFPSGGGGIFLNKACLKLFYNNIDSYINEWKNIYSKFSTRDGQPIHYSSTELALAYFLKRDFKIACTEEYGFYFFPPDTYEKTPIFTKEHHKRYKLVPNPVTFHNLKPLNPVFIDLHNKANNKQTPFETKC